MIFIFKLNFFFSVDTIAYRRFKFKHKICFKDKYEFLQLKYTPTTVLSSRFIKRGNFIKIYKCLKLFYYNYFLKKKIYKKRNTSLFFFFFKRYYSFRDLNNILYWKLMTYNILFSFKKKKIIKKKKIKKKIKKSVNRVTIYLHYLSGIKRMVFCLSCLKFIILLSCKKKQQSININLFKCLNDFILNDKNNKVLDIKNQIYHYKLLLTA